MSRTFVAFVLAALVAFSSYFPGSVFAYGSIPAPLVVKTCYYMSTEYAGQDKNTCTFDPQVAGDLNLAAYVKAANGSVCNGYNFTSYSGSVSGSSYSYTLTKTNCNGTAGGTSSGAWSIKTRTINSPSCDSSNVVGSDGSCYCQAGSSPDSNGTCHPYQCPSAGSVIPGSEGHTYSLPEGSPGGTTACVSGCVVTGSLAVAYTDSSGVKHSEIAGPMRATGQQCNPSGQGGNLPSLGAANPGDSAASAPSVCPVGQCPGQVNGTNVCVACSSSTSSNVTSSGSQASGGTITTTECTGGNCVTKTGTIDSAGNVTYNNYSSGSGSSATNTGAGNGSGQQSQDQQDFCASHPDSMICKTSGWGGSCGSWSCSGDAVQCQIAKMQADLWCGTQLPEGAQDKYNALTGEGAASAAFGDNMALELPKPEAAQCAVQDTQITFIGGVPLVVPLSNMCEYLGYIHAVVVSFGVLMWVFIVFRGK